jgi:hypothetical protein
MIARKTLAEGDEEATWVQAAKAVRCSRADDHTRCHQPGQHTAVIGRSQRGHSILISPYLPRLDGVQEPSPEHPQPLADRS